MATIKKFVANNGSGSYEVNTTINDDRGGLGHIGEVIHGIMFGGGNNASYKYAYFNTAPIPGRQILWVKWNWKAYGEYYANQYYYAGEGSSIQGYRSPLEIRTSSSGRV